jgi:hypothetical protein
MNKEIALLELEDEEYEEDELFLIVCLSKKKYSRFWVHHLWQEQSQYGAYHHQKQYILLKLLKNVITGNSHCIIV